MIQVDLDQFNREVKGLESWIYKQSFPEVKKRFSRWAAKLQNDMVRETKGKSLQSRSGNLSQSWRIAVGGTSLKTLFAEVWNGAKYAVTHQIGMTIRPKRAKFLTIPIDKTRAGDARYNATIARGEYDHTFVKKSKRGNLIIFGKNDGSNELKPLFLLKKQVTIPKRLNFFERAIDGINKMIAGG